MYLRIDEDGGFETVNRELTEDDYQAIENEEVNFIRWNSEQKKFQLLVANSSSTEDDPDEITWETAWVGV